MAKEKLQKTMEATLWAACNKLRGSVEPSEYKHVMLDRNEIVSIFHNWRLEEKFSEYADVKGLCKSIKINELNDYSLVPSKYIEFDDEIEEIDIEAEKEKIGIALQKSIKGQQDNQEDLLKAIRELGYEIKL